jgi:hypothetical protein
MTDDPLYLGFTRRRQFLVAVSLALAAAGFLGLRIEEIDVVGNKAIVGNPGRIIFLGYLVWLWALWTYKQWFNDYRAWQKTRSAFIEIRDRRLIKSLGKIEADPERLKTIKGPMIQAAVSKFAPDGGRLADQLVFEVQAESIYRDKNNKLGAVCMVMCWQPSFPTGYQGFGQSDRYSIPIKSSTHAVEASRAFVELVLSTRYITEYFAPFLIALLPLFAVAVRVAINYGNKISI